MNFDAWQWALAGFGALLIGLSKTGIGGLGMLFVAIFAGLMPAKQSSGFVLPMLVFADVVAVVAYRRHARWRFLWRLFPWTALGVVLGYFAMARIDDRTAKLLVGVIVCGMVAVHVLRRGRAKGGAEAGHGWWFAPTVGVLAGFTTLIANAAGPLMAIYLLAMRLPKMEYMGTGAVYFLLMNAFKVPFMARLGLIDGASFTANLWLLPAVIAGAFMGRAVLHRINQTWFENLALALAVTAGLNLLRQTWHG